MIILKFPHFFYQNLGLRDANITRTVCSEFFPVFLHEGGYYASIYGIYFLLETALIKTAYNLMVLNNLSSISDGCFFFYHSTFQQNPLLIPSVIVSAWAVLILQLLFTLLMKQPTLKFRDRAFRHRE